jgi:CBS domain-containing protein
MADTVRQLMTASPLAVDVQMTLPLAAQMMRDNDIGDVLVTEDGRLQGILTDRDIVVRAVANERDVALTTAGECCSRDVHTIGAENSARDAAQLMRDHALRRLPVTDGGQLVGIISIGDLAVEQDPGSALADISAAPPNDWPHGQA